MKQKKLKSGKVVSYGFSDPEMHKALRSRRHTVIADKKKQASKQICRSRSRRDQADFFFVGKCCASTIASPGTTYDKMIVLSEIQRGSYVRNL